MRVHSSSAGRTGLSFIGSVLTTMLSQVGPSRAGGSGRLIVGRPSGDPGLHVLPVVKFADEQQRGFAVLEDLAHGACR